MQVTMSKMMKALVIGIIEAVRAETTCSCQGGRTHSLKVNSQSKWQDEEMHY